MSNNIIKCKRKKFELTVAQNYEIIKYYERYPSFRIYLIWIIFILYNKRIFPFLLPICVLIEKKLANWWLVTIRVFWLYFDSLNLGVTDVPIKIFWLFTFREFAKFHTVCTSVFKFAFLLVPFSSEFLFNF